MCEALECREKILRFEKEEEWSDEPVERFQSDMAVGVVC